MSPARDPAGFVRDNTVLAAPPHVPEIVLHLATDALPLWRSTEEELEAAGLPLPFWAFAWAGGQALARYVLDNGALVEGRRVLVFAAGSGLEAIASAMRGAGHVVATDIDPFARAAMPLNATANGVSFEVSGLDVLAQAFAALQPSPEVVLLGDVFYEKPMAERVAAWAGGAVAAGATVLVGDPGRAYLPKDRLEALAEYRVPTTLALEDAEVKRTIVWRFKG